MCYTTLGSICESVRQSVRALFVKSVQKGDNVLLNMILAGRVLLVKKLTELLLNRTVYFDQTLHMYT